MHPAFRSSRSAIAFCCLLAFFITLPMLLSLTKLPAKEQDFLTMSNAVGPVGWVARQIYEDPRPADVLFLGSSRVMEGIRPDLVEQALSKHLGRPAHVAVLALNWPGEDFHAKMLQDYLARHPATLIVWNMPQPGASTDGPHVQAYHWVRYGQDRDERSALSLHRKMQLYAEEMFGAPRALLTALRTNLVGADENSLAAYGRFEHEDEERRVGYNGSRFVEDPAPPVAQGQPLLQPVPSPALEIVGPPPVGYQLNSIRSLVRIANESRSKLVLLHVPTVEEFGQHQMPEIGDWSRILGPDYKMIGAPGTVLFAEFTPARVQHLFQNHTHFNRNGATWFTESILPAVLQAYDSNR